MVCKYFSYKCLLAMTMILVQAQPLIQQEIRGHTRDSIFIEFIKLYSDTQKPIRPVAWLKPIEPLAGHKHSLV